MKPPVTIAALLAALAVAGCGGGGGEGGGAPTVPAEPPAEPGEAQGGRVVVDIVELEFVPDDVTVPAGATIVFTNSDSVSHTITKREGPGPDFDSGPVEPGGTFSQVFPEEGVVEIFDTTRPRTQLTVTVEEAEGTQQEDEAGGAEEEEGAD